MPGTVSIAGVRKCRDQKPDANWGDVPNGSMSASTRSADRGSPTVSRVPRRVPLVAWRLRRPYRYARACCPQPGASGSKSGLCDQTRGESQKLLADVAHTRHALRDAEQMAAATRPAFAGATLERACSSSRNRLVPTRMLGGVGAGTGNRTSYPISSRVWCPSEKAEFSRHSTRQTGLFGFASD